MKKNIIDLLKADHRKIEALFTAIEKAKGGRRAAQFERLYEEITTHAEAEEAVLYPRLQEFVPLRRGAFAAFEEHALVKHLLTELSSGEPASEKWDGQLMTLKTLIETHVAEEEDVVFPKLRKLMERPDLLKLGEWLVQYKKTGVAPVDERSWRESAGFDLIPQPQL